MFELTSAQYRFRQAVPEGDFYEALGLSPKATSLDVDVAGSRLAEQVPSMAAEVSRVVNVLTHRQRKTLYDAVRKVRDEVANSLASHYGAEFSRTVPNFRLDLWGRCCRLFRFDLTGDEQKLGKNGRQALAEAGPGWIIRDLLDACVSPGESGRGGSPTFAIVGSVTSASTQSGARAIFRAAKRGEGRHAQGSRERPAEATIGKPPNDRVGCPATAPRTCARRALLCRSVLSPAGAPRTCAFFAVLVVDGLAPVLFRAAATNSRSVLLEDSTEDC